MGREVCGRTDAARSAAVGESLPTNGEPAVDRASTNRRLFYTHCWTGIAITAPRRVGAQARVAPGTRMLNRIASSDPATAVGVG